MKLTFVCHKVQGRGGTETVLVKVLNHFAKENNEVKLILSNSPADQSWLDELDESISIKKPISGNKIVKATYFSKIFILADKDEVFILLSANLIKFAKKVQRIFHKKNKIISWIHFSLFEQEMFNPFNIKYADYHLAISSVIRKQLISLGIPQDKIYLVLNPIKKNVKFSDKKIENDQLKHFIFVGRVTLDGQKNLRELFNAFSLIESEKIVLDVFGSGKDVVKCKAYCEKKGIKNRIVWHGWVSNVWETIDFKPIALILSSKFEGLPMVAIEAMSRGISVISSNFKGVNDVVNTDNGWQYKLGNSKELATKIIDAVEHSKNPDTVMASINKFYEPTYFKNFDEVLKKIEG